MQSLVARVRRTIRRHDLVPRGARVLVALSGGSDSIALVHLLIELQRAGDLQVAGLAHLNHQLRGSASDKDAAFCEAVARSLNLPLILEAADVTAAARFARQSIEQTARGLRYDFLHRAAASLSADRIAVGHTRNDQAETYLLRLIRGAGPDGLAGIRPRVGMVVRPLLEVERDELRDYLTRCHLDFRDDASNLDVTIPRNRVRHELLPLLRGRFSAGILQALTREADIAREDADYFNQLVSLSLPDVVSRHGASVIVDVPALRECPPPVTRRLVREAMRQVAPDQFIGFDAVDRVLELTDKMCGTGRVDLPGQRAHRDGETIVLRSRRGRAAAGGGLETAAFSYSLDVPGEVMLPEAACRISAELGELTLVNAPLNSTRDRVVVAAAALEVPLRVRSRQNGDIFRPLGLRGRKKLQDFFVDRKVHRADRDRVPLVVDHRERIVWVAGHAVGEEFRVTDPAKPVVILRMTHLGGQG